MAQGSESLPLELQILELFHGANLAVIGPTDVERMTGVSKGTVSAKLRALAEAGYLQEVSRGRYQPGGRMFALGTCYLGVVMKQLDQVQQFTVERLTGVREAIQQLAAIFPEGQA